MLLVLYVAVVFSAAFAIARDHNERELLAQLCYLASLLILAGFLRNTHDSRSAEERNAIFLSCLVLPLNLGLAAFLLRTCRQRCRRKPVPFNRAFLLGGRASLSATSISPISPDHTPQSTVCRIA